ncbi:MAG TPA: AAA family ATPase [Acidimicrobiia bacterium]|nr:AAA family ATPase [Acidimicrobiia bacterium]
MASTDLVTIVSTDWVGSTATRTRLGEDRADQLQHLHDTILKDTIEQHDGIVIKNSGDGVLATFHSATDALAAGVAIQQRFDAHSSSRPDDEAIALRVGISAGDVVRRDDDIFGASVVEAVRLQSIAAPRQILCSDLVRALGRGRGGFEFELVGLVELKGLPEPVAACSVVWAPSEQVAAVPMPPELIAGAATEFVGREEELALVADCVMAAERAHAVWLLGEPGIGKTRLGQEVASLVHRRGALVLYGRCDEQVRAPFQPVIDGLRWFVSQCRDDELRGVLGVDPEPLVRLVPELLSRMPGLRPPEAATETEQYRLFESVRSWLSMVAATQPLVFVVDDVHWADRPTLALLGHIARSAQPARLTILATARDTSPDVSAAFNDLVDELERTGCSRRLPLRGLTVDDIASLLEATTLPADNAARLADETAGNPLFLRAVLSGMRADGTLPMELPTDVRAAVRRRLGRFEPATLELLQVAALSGLEFFLGVVSDAAGLGEHDGLRLVEQAVGAGLVDEVAVDRFRFTHALVRDALVAELSASRRARMHAALADVIETRFAARLSDHLRALAQHYANAGAPEKLERALDYAKRSARRSIDLLAFEAAVEDYSFALELVARMPTYPERSKLELLICKGDAQQLDGDHASAVATFRAAADLARAEGDWEAFTRAAIAFEETAWRPGMHGPEAVALLREALEHETLPVQRVWLQASCGRALHYSGAFDDSRRLVEDALTEARELDDLPLISHALAASAQSLARFQPGEAELVLARAEESAGVAAALNDLAQLGTVAQYATVAALCRGDKAQYERWFQEFQRTAEIDGLRFSRYVSVCDFQLRSFLAGDLEAAESQANRALEIVQAREDVSGVHGVQMFLIRREQARLGELASVVRMLLQLNPTEAMWRPGLVLLLAEVGMYDEARTLLHQLAADDFADLPRDILFLGSLCFCAETAYLLGELEIAQAIEHQLRPWADSGATLGHVTGYIGAVNRYLGLIAWVLGDVDEADRRFADALEFDRRLGAVPWVARTLADRAVLRETLGDRDVADRLAREARDLADRHDLAAVRVRLGEIGMSDGSAADGRRGPS